MDWIVMTYLGQLGLGSGELFISLLYILSAKTHPYFSVNQVSMTHFSMAVRSMLGVLRNVGVG